MFVISNGFTYIAFLMLVAGSILALEKYSRWKIFNIVPALVWIYLLNMVFCTLGMFDSPQICVVYDGLKNNLLYAMIFTMLLHCDLRRLAKLGPRMVFIFLGCSATLAAGMIVGYPLFVQYMGGPEKTWAAVAALYSAWVGGSANMAAISSALPVDEGAYGAALALDTVCYILWIGLLLVSVRHAKRWNAAVKADTSKLDDIAKTVNAAVSRSRKRASASDWVFLIGLSMSVSALAQHPGVILDGALSSVGLELLGSNTCTTLLVTVLGLICACTPLNKMPAIEDLSNVYLYAVVALMSSQASLSALTAAPVWVLYGLFILLIHAVLMALLSKIFHWDLCMVSTASLANIGGSASAPIIASAYDPAYAGIGILMGIFGAAISNFLGLGMGAVLQLFV